MEERRREDMLMAKLTRQSNEERRIVAKLAEARDRHRTATRTARA